jgi:hypothetical protein
MQPLKNELPRSDDVLFVFYDFETTQDTKFSDNATVHIQFLYPCSSSVRLVGCKMILIWIACAVVGDTIHSSKTLSETCYHISVNLDPSVKRSWQ